MNFVKNPTSEALDLAQILVATAIGIVVIILSCRAYRQTKVLGFVLWIVSSVLSLAAIIGWDVIGHAYSYPRFIPLLSSLTAPSIWFNSLVSAIGTVMVIREFMRISKREIRKAPNCSRR